MWMYFFKINSDLFVCIATFFLPMPPLLFPFTVSQDFGCLLPFEFSHKMTIQPFVITLKNTQLLLAEMPLTLFLKLQG
jgi:hypothetical protein